jgi:hypothetical protein
MISIGISFIGYSAQVGNGGASAPSYSSLKVKTGGMFLLKSGGRLKLKSIY